MRKSLVLAIVLLLTSCGGDPDAGTDAGRRDAAIDAASLDAGPETSDDASAPDASSEVDAGSDAGPPVPPTSMGCVDGEGLTEGEHTFMLEGRSRRYILRLPEGYTNERAWPLVLALHGNGGNTSYWDGTSGARNMRGILRNDAILVVTHAIEGNWRDYDLPEAQWPARIESELMYFEEVLTQARTELCIREDAIFSMGFSGGGSFSGVLACRRTDIRAIAVGGSVLYFDPEECVGTSAAWINIGTADGELSGGRIAYREYFRERAGCDPESMSTEPDPCVAYDGCDEATPVHYCEHPGGHIWPDFASEATWAFFESLID